MSASRCAEFVSMLESMTDSCRVFKYFSRLVCQRMHVQIASTDAVVQLCAEILDPARTAPIVGVCPSAARETRWPTSNC